DRDSDIAAENRALVGAEALEQTVHDAGAARVGEELAVIADEAAAGRAYGQARLAPARGPHVGHLGLAKRHLVDDRAGEFVVDVDDDSLIRLLAAIGTVAEQDSPA